MTTESNLPVEAPATSVDTGKPCPYCRFPLKEGAATTSCGYCSAMHHSDCWTDNAGCAVVACQGGPKETPKSAPAPAPAVAAAASVSPIVPTIDPKAPYAGGQGMSFDEVVGEVRKLGGQIVDGLSPGAQIAAGGGIALFLSLFFKWFSIGAVRGAAFAGQNGWSMTLGSLLLVVIAVVAIAPAVIQRRGMELNISFDLPTAVAATGALAFVYVAIRGLITKPGTFQGVKTSASIGVVIALAATAAICFGGYKLMSESDRHASGESG